MTSKNVANKFSTRTELEHMKKTPGMFIGPCQILTEELFVYNENNDESDSPIKIINKSIDFIPGLQRIYEEILLNAFDQTVREGTNCNEIHVDIDQTTSTIIVKNNGQGIPIIIKEGINCYIPEMVFGMLRASSNYDETEKKLTGGQNGMGSTLTNIFSSEFTVETVDSDTKQKYVQTWNDNMSIKNPPTISKYTKKPYTKITFKPDLEYFKISQLSNDMISLMKKRLIDIGFSTHSKVKTFFNKENFTCKGIEDYMKLYDHGDNNNFIIDSTNDRWSIGLTVSNNGFQHAAFANGIHNSHGGTHVDHVVNIIVKEIVAKLKTKKIEAKPSDIKSNMFIFVNAAIENPTFDSQTKECLKTPKTQFGSEYKMSTAFASKLLKSKIMTNVITNAKLHEDKSLNKSNGTKKKHLNIKNLDDAIDAGSSKSSKTRLILTEGASAKTFVMGAIEIIGHDRFGIFPLKGKPLNVREVSPTKINANDEIVNIVKILGLKFKTKYEDTSSLRYGGVILIADADVDGNHICALVLNIFHYFWPELIDLGYVSFCATPIVKVTKGSNIIPFYSINEYNEWMKENSKSKFTAKYFKGLGTSTAKDAKEELSNIDDKIVVFDQDKTCDDSMLLAFDKSKADDRKEWLMERYNPTDEINKRGQTVNVSDYINKELIHFSYYDNQRSIPNIMDGFKPSQRKIMHIALKYIMNDSLKVAQFAAKVSEKTDYHHGEVSLMGAIIGMAQNFVGSNNANLLNPNGMFGSRLHGGKDASAPRYIFTETTNIAKTLFNTQDSPLLNYLQSDGMTIEPDWFVPVLPMILINGTKGIGTGFSSEVLKYNLNDVANYILKMLNDEKPVKNLTPWYRGFDGTIKRISSGKYVSYGKWEFDDSKFMIKITELPIGMWTKTYDDFIKDSITNKTFGINYQIARNSDSKINLELYLESESYTSFKSMTPDEFASKFKLSTKLSGTNMYLFNHHGMITKYKNVYSIIKEYFSVRLEYYLKRKNNLIEQLEYEIMILKNKVRFIKFVKDGTIKPLNLSDQSLLELLINKKFDIDTKLYDEQSLQSYSYLVNIQYRMITNENAEKLTNQYKSKLEELEIIKNTTTKDMWKSDIELVIKSNEIANEKLHNEMIQNKNVKGKKSGKRTVSKRKITKK